MPDSADPHPLLPTKVQKGKARCAKETQSDLCVLHEFVSMMMTLPYRLGKATLQLRCRCPPDGRSRANEVGVS